tara:strand:- start:504 stop:737 length:234 start_codon:yes stop_codon:yes gene_type:complete
MAKKEDGILGKVGKHFKDGALQVADDVHYILGTKRGKDIEKSLDEKYPYRTRGMKKGGSVTRGDGIAKRGHTKGKMV